MNRTQLILVLGCVAVGLAIFVFGERFQTKTNVVDNASSSVFNEDKLINETLGGLTAEKSARLGLLNKALKSKKGAAFLEGSRQLALSFDSSFSWGASAIFYEKLAVADKLAETWALAGNRYLSAFDMSADSIAIQWFGFKALNSFKQAYSIDSTNLDVKADLGKAIMLISTSDPMAGLSLLREITKQNPTHLRANLNLAQLSIKSNQMQKAMDRFKLIIENYPSYPEGYLGLSESSLSLGDTATALQSLKEYKALVKDPAITRQVDIFIKELTKN